MLFAAEPDAANLGQFVQNACYLSVTLLAFIGMICTVYATFFKKKEQAPQDEAATRAEVNSYISNIKTDLSALVAAVKGELFAAVNLVKNDATNSVTSIKADLMREVTRVDKELLELRQRYHDHNGKLHVMNLRLQRIDMMNTQLTVHAGLPLPPEVKISPQDEV